jgi:phenylpropionate dioxygenase-like ring-hydroxylating dioxygenase large terminal subunit
MASRDLSADWDPDDFVTDDRISGAVYREPLIFERELRSIFDRYWVYVGHESEVAKPGGYKTTWIGLQPVIFHRAKHGGQLHVFMNRCRHRGTTLCREGTGEVTNFTCPYHGWAYDGSGKLVGVPLKEDYDASTLEQLSLVEAPRVASYHGLVFASLAQDGPSLEEHLGHAKPYLDAITEYGVIVGAGRQQYESGANWKLQLENSVDNYHPRTTHRVFKKLFRDRGDESLGYLQTGDSLDLGNGHGLLAFDEPTNAVSKRHNFNLTVFPNLAFIGVQIRVIRPVSPRNSVVELYPMFLEGESDEERGDILRVHEDMFGPAGFATPDDVDLAMSRVDDGLSAVAGDDWAYVGKGLTKEVIDANGIRRGASMSDETAVRALYREWRRALRVE